MQAVILAAGKSSRFYPYTTLAHKSLVTILGKTILEHTLGALKKTGITDIILIISPESPIKKLLGSGATMGLHITYVVQQETLGGGHALLQAEQYIIDDFFLLNAYHFEIDQFVADMQQKKQKKEEIVLLGKKLAGINRYGYMLYHKNNVTAIVEKPKEVLENALHIIGIYLLSKHFFKTLRETPLSHYHFEEALDAYAKSGNVTFLETEKKTITLKYAWDLLEVKDYFLQDITPAISPQAEVSPHAIISGNVIVATGAKIFEGACIKGPCYIGKNVVVGTNALVRDGVIAEEGVVIGAYMEVKNSLLMKDTTTHSGFIGDSVVGGDGKIGAEICTTNVRLDREIIFPTVKEERVNSYRKHLGVLIGTGVILGARVTTMPGVIIGNTSIVGPSVVVMKNIPDSVEVYSDVATIQKKRI